MKIPRYLWNLWQESRANGPWQSWTGPKLASLLGMVLLAAMTAPNVIAQGAGGQSISAPPKPQTLVMPEANRPPDVNEQMRMQRDHVNKENFDKANTERMRQIDDESVKLLILTMDLKAKMDRAGKGKLPPELVREAEVIEILARDVQEKMKLTVGGG